MIRTTPKFEFEQQVIYMGLLLHVIAQPQYSTGSWWYILGEIKKDSNNTWNGDRQRIGRPVAEADIFPVED